MQRGLLLISTVLIAFVVVPAATAVKPDRTPIPAPAGDSPVPGCAFPVLGHIDGAENKTLFFDRTGTPVKQIQSFPGQTLTLTNVDTQKSITVSDAGSTQVRAKRDGSFTISITGHGPLPNDVVGEPGIWYLNGGRVFVTLDENGNPTSIEVTGNVENLCDRLAA